MTNLEAEAANDPIFRSPKPRVEALSNRNARAYYRACVRDGLDEETCDAPELYAAGMPIEEQRGHVVQAHQPSLNVDVRLLRGMVYAPFNPTTVRGRLLWISQVNRLGANITGYSGLRKKALGKLYYRERTRLRRQLS